MNYRSTNETGYVHFGGALIAGVEQGSGIELNPTSSGGTPVIKPAGDEENKNIGIAGKGTGGVSIGSSGSALKEVLSAVIQFTPPELSSGASAAAESTHTFTGCSTGTVLHFTPANTINSRYTYRVRCSTVNEAVITWGMIEGSTVGSGESTNHGRLLQWKF